VPVDGGAAGRQLLSEWRGRREGREGGKGREEHGAVFMYSLFPPQQGMGIGQVVM